MSELSKIDKLMELYESYKRWEWRFGETPQFTNQIEKKFDWALMDVEMNVEKGVITKGVCYSDCLVPAFIDELNDVLASGKLTYDEQGINNMGNTLLERFPDNEVIREKYVPELVAWMRQAI